MMEPPRDATRRGWLGRIARSLDLRRHPELELFPTELQARKALRRATFKLIKKPVYMATVLVAVAISVTSNLALRAAVSNLGLPINQVLRDLILAVPVTIACCGFGLWVLNRFISRLLRQELLDGDVPVCTQCGYHLYGLPGPECPECGRLFDARVRQILKIDAASPAPE